MRDADFIYVPAGVMHFQQHRALFFHFYSEKR